LKIVFFGTPEFAVPSLQGLLKAGHEITAVVTQPDRQAGRGRQVRSCPVKIEAENNGLRVLQPQRVRDDHFIRELEIINPSAIVVVAYGQILPPGILHLPEYGCINVHASLLPDYRGAAPVNWALMKGEKKTGITIMFMDEGMDTGPVLLQEAMEIKDDDTAGILSRRLSEAGAQLLIPALDDVGKGALIPQPQAGKVSYAPPLEKKDALIEWSNTAKELSHFIRGMNPWPGAYSFLEGKRIRILKGVPVVKDGEHQHDQARSAGEPGTIDTATRNELLINTGSGKIAILELQPSGKPVMPVMSFLQGRTLRKGMRFHDS
jgi:methionyl-tRNA formyltransferase